ncbi:CLI_3235 family bacteriocin precursor [Clostridium brassicae]|uniref:CLI_3235 family bacteriocin precursor n=1 Tax=Clostridium brassicae TaxID=2999072 RepID=UPI0038990B3C
MKKLNKKNHNLQGTLESYSCNCPTSCYCNTQAKKNSNYVELVRFSYSYIVLG